ncbi:MAG: hypothetical protein IIW50_06605 [Alistipes sp.]|nr:hypothetical protein [Alistipes sp.]MBQ5855451.1 hypothetical protein [Alistipes sp.]
MVVYIGNSDVQLCDIVSAAIHPLLPIFQMGICYSIRYFSVWLRLFHFRYPDDASYTWRQNYGRYLCSYCHLVLSNAPQV